MTKIKICGLRRLDDITAVNQLLPDYVGFVFAESKRQVSPILAAALRQELAPEIKAVGVFVNEAPETVAETANLSSLDIIQLHGDEQTADIERLRSLCGCEIWKAVRVNHPLRQTELTDYSADRYLLDAFSSSGYGGLGETFDHTLLSSLEPGFLGDKVFIAGGLTPGNVQDILRSQHPYGVDISSGVETDGFKDAEKIRQFIQQIRDL